MKSNNTIKLLGFFCLLCCFQTVQAQSYLKARAELFLRKTAGIIKESHKFLPDLEAQKLNGTFDKSVKHQRFALDLYEDEQYLNAIHHSDYARRLAFNIYHVRNDFKPKSWEYSKVEKSSLSNMPFNETLDQRLEERNPQIFFDDTPYLTDKVLYDLEFDDYR